MRRGRDDGKDDEVQSWDILGQRSESELSNKEPNAHTSQFWPRSLGGKREVIDAT